MAAFLAALALATLGLLDDMRGLSARIRLVMQFVIVAAYLLADGFGDYPAIAPVVALPLIVWGINATNFVDGADGFVSLQLLLCAATVVLLPISAFATLLLSVAVGALLGFLPWNWQRASIFLGDSGSYFLGFAMSVGILTAPRADISAFAVLALIAPIAVDAGATLLWRAWRGENLAIAHRDHNYQWLVRSGRPHAHVALLYAALTTTLAIPVVALFPAGPAATGACAAVYTLNVMIWLLIRRRLKRFGGAAH